MITILKINERKKGERRKKEDTCGKNITTTAEVPYKYSLSQ
jgi:hypothetical protein